MSSSSRLRNKILQRLPEAEYERIAGRMERVTPALGEVVTRPGEPPKWVHFPESGVLSSMVVLEDGSTVEANARPSGGTPLSFRNCVVTASRCR